MKQRALVLLIVITVAAVTAAVIGSRYRAPQATVEKTPLFPELGSRINDVSEIIIEGKGKTLTLVKEGEVWTIGQTGGYPALFTKIKPVIIGISELQVVAKKTSNPELYSRLGVEDPAGDRAISHLVTLKNETGDLAALIIGKPQKSAGAGGDGLYVRLPGQKQSLLVEGTVEISPDVTDWIERNLFDIGPERIKSIHINHPGGGELTLSRVNDIDTFTIADIPDGKEPQSEVVLNRMQTLLEDFFVSNIKAGNSLAFPEDKVITTIRTFDGLIVTVTSARIDDENLSRFTFGFEEPAAEKAPEATAGETAGAAKPDVKGEAEALNRKYSPWVFVIPDFKYEILVKEKDKLLRDRKKDSPENTGP